MTLKFSLGDPITGTGRDRDDRKRGGAVNGDCITA